MSIRVLIVDDHALVRRGFRMILDNEPDIDVTAEAEDGRAASDAARASGVRPKGPGSECSGQARTVLALPGWATRRSTGTDPTSR